MPQGSKKMASKAKARGKAQPYSKKLSKSKTKKGNPSTSGRKNFNDMRGKMQKKLTGVIHNNIESVILGKCVAAGNRMKMDSLMSAGKAKVREVKKVALTKKTSIGKFQARLVDRIEKLKTEGKAHD